MKKGKHLVSLDGAYFAVRLQIIIANKIDYQFVLSNVSIPS